VNGGADERSRLEATLRAAIVNTPAQILALYDARSIELSTPQLIRLHLTMDSLAARIDANVAALVLAMLDEPKLQATADAQARYRALVREAQELIDWGVRSSKEIVGPLRWQELPEGIHSPSREIPSGVVRRARGSS
jgi:hypothetical protein